MNNQELPKNLTISPSKPDAMTQTTVTTKSINRNDINTSPIYFTIRR
jgi:hypothetical protein